MIFKELLIFASGAAIGAVLGLRIAQKNYDEKFEEEVEHRIDEIMAEKEKEEASKEAENKEKMLKEKVQYNNIVGSSYARKIMTNAAEKEEETQEENDDDELPRTAADYEHPEDDDEVAENPYYIDEDDFDATNGYDKESLYWYKGNNTLVNDSDEVISDMDDVAIMIGTEWASYKGYGVIYIRNEKLKTDYELVINTGEYPSVGPLQ